MNLAFPMKEKILQLFQQPDAVRTYELLKPLRGVTKIYYRLFNPTSTTKKSE